MKAMSLIASLLTLCITLPIWYYLQYKILGLVGATELMWFLFWIYIPVAIVSQLLLKIGEHMGD